MSQNKKLPMMENMKKIKMRSVTTFMRDGMENWIVYKIAWSPAFLPASFRILVTLIILATLASYESVDNIERSASRFCIILMMISKIEKLTTMKSNLFHEFLK
jgi:hypothetical protein